MPRRHRRTQLAENTTPFNAEFAAALEKDLNLAERFVDAFNPCCIARPDPNSSSRNQQ